eukprot:2446213-Prymnesium_polylepis.1
MSGRSVGGTFRDTGMAGVLSFEWYRITGDTRVLVVNPSHLMVASRGPVPFYGSPPTPDSL